MQMEDIESILWIHFSAKNEKETIVPFAQERKKGTRRIFKFGAKNGTRSLIQRFNSQHPGIMIETCSLF